MGISVECQNICGDGPGRLPAAMERYAPQQSLLPVGNATSFRAWPYHKFSFHNCSCPIHKILSCICWCSSTCIVVRMQQTSWTSKQYSTLSQRSKSLEPPNSTLRSAKDPNLLNLQTVLNTQPKIQTSWTSKQYSTLSQRSKPPEPPNRTLHLSLIHIWRCRRDVLCRSRWSPYH